ncbi:cation-transporting P-type ATPase [Ostreiculturibacter nitratireducens]|uniref:cation-translocating P-type ATPase n=1 Tax=Ostreiculturibacter nitratireducens TaxID=3075226 RepID=UPI0031B64FFC
MPPTLPETPFALPVEEVAAALGTVPKRGLDAEEVLRRRRVHGPNRMRRHKPKSALAILAHQFKSIIVWLLAVASGVSFFLGDIADSLAIVVVLVINGTIGFVTELRAARSMEALLRVAEVRTRVRRGGEVREVNARDLVPGDLVVLEAGDVVTADLRLAEASNLQCDESVLTGESVPVAKGIAPIAPDALVGDRGNMAFKGTAITQGAGEGIVVATGMRTEIGRISDLAQSAEAEATPLEKRLDRLGQWLVWLTLGIAALTVLAGVLRGYELTGMIQTGVALAVAAVPEGLPVVATLSLARGMWLMAARNAIITKLSSVETLGATTVILTDKTGTLTENRMTAVRYILDACDVDFTSRKAIGAEDERLRWALRVGALCNNAELGDGSEATRSGDPMEVALLVAARRAGLGRPSLLEARAEVKEHAFDPDRKMMATVHADGDVHLYAVKGAPESVIPCCNRVLAEDGPRDLDVAERADWASRSDAAARDGLRLLALAMKHRESAEEAPYEALMLVGLVCLIDPLRADVPSAIRASRRAGVRVVMLTGDHADTAAKIARDAGLGDGPLAVIEGYDLVDFDAGNADGERRERLLAADVFARVAPEMKLTLVALYQESGQVVAMTGDGVNDAPALKKADIGIAMGQRGTEVAREAADMVLKDDAFETIIAAMQQGRVIFGNIRKFVVYLMSCNVSEVLVVGLAVGAGLPTPLLPLQILFLNLVTDVFPAFALGLGAGDDNVMRQPPRDPAEPILDGARWTQIGVLGGVITFATLTAFGLARFRLGLDAGASVTVAFLTLALAQLWNVFNVRAPDSGLLRNEVTRNPFIWAALSLSLGLVALALWLPALADLLRLPAPGNAGLALAAGMSLLPLAIGQIFLKLAPFLRPRQGRGEKGAGRRAGSP